MKTYRKVVTLAMALQMSFSPLFSLATVQAVDLKQGGSVPAVVEPTVKSTTTPVDWSEMDWEREIVLPQDLEKSYQELQEKLMEKKPVGVKNVVAKKVKMSDSRSMKYFQVPSEVQKVVSEFTSKGKMTEDQKMSLKSILKSTSGQNIFQKSGSDATTIINFDPKAPKFVPQKTTPILVAPKLEFKEKNVLQKKPAPTYPIFPIYKNAAKEKVKSISDVYSKKVSLKNIFLSFFGETAQAAVLRPIIESSSSTLPQDEALYYLSQSQHDDGSFGEENTFTDTYRMLEFLSEINKTDNDQYALALQFARNYVPTNTREKAVKIRLLSFLQQPYLDQLNPLLLLQNEDGGYGLDTGYESDVLTTLDVVETLTFLGNNQNNTLTRSLVFLTEKIEPTGVVRFTPNSNANYYLMNRMLRALKPFENSQLQGDDGNIVMRDKINAMLQFLTLEYSTDTSLLRSSIDAIDFGMTLTSFDLYNIASSTQSSLKNALLEKQMTNGSFDNRFLPTLESLNAFSAANVEVTAIILLDQLKSGDPATVTLTLKNTGLKPTSKMDVHLFLDSLYFSTAQNIQNQGVVLDPGDTVQVRLNIPDTITLVGNVKVAAYVETQNDVDENNNWIETERVFATRVQNQPSLPTFYIAQTNSLNGQLGLAVKWGVKDDVNRAGYVVMFRALGQANWNYAFLPNGMQNVFLSSPVLQQGQIYEVTMGVTNANNNVTYFSEPTRVQVSVRDSEFVGNIQGTLTNLSQPAGGTFLYVSGNVNTSSGQNGEIAVNSVPNGSVLLSVTSTPQMESFLTRVVLPTNGQLQNVRVFTKLKKDVTSPVISAVGKVQADIVRNLNETEFFVRGFDNIALKGALFFIYNPQTLQWEFLGESNQRFGLDEFHLQWLVPESYGGQNFKIKAVLYDFQNNYSSEVESGAFEIMNGLPPTFTFTSPTSTSAWPIGSSQTLSWNTSAGNAVPTVDIKILNNNAIFDTLASGVPNTGSWVWNIPATSFYASPNIQFQIEGRDSRTALRGTSMSSVFATVNNSPGPALPWISEENMSDRFTSTTGPGQVQGVQGVIAPDGSSTYVFRFVNDVMGSPRVITENLYAVTRTANGVWGNPISLYSRQTQTNDALQGYTWIDNFSLSRNSQGQFAVVYSMSQAGDCSVFNQKEIFSIVQSPAGVWSQPQNISSNQTYSYFPQITSDNIGGFHVIWVDGMVYTPDCQFQNVSSIRYRNYSPAAGWGAIQSINSATFPQKPQIQVTTNGKIHLVYKDENRIARYMSGQNNVWTNPISLLATPVSQIQLQKGSTSTLAVAIRDEVTENGVLRTRVQSKMFDGTLWQLPQEVFPNERRFFWDTPFVTLDAQNRPHIFVIGTNLQDQKRKIYWSSRSDNGVFTPPQSIYRSLTEFTPTFFSVINAQNKMGVIFTASSHFTEQYFLSTADMGLDITPPPIPLGAQVLSQPGNIRLNWNAYPAQPDFDHFSIYRGVNATSSLQNLAPFAVVTSSVSNFYIDTAVTTSSLYYYALTVVDRSGNENKNVSWVGPVRPAVVPPPAPPAPALVELIRDGDMEQATTTYWGNLGALSYQKTVATMFRGRQSLFVNATGRIGGVEQRDLRLVPGGRYTLNVRYRLNSGIFMPVLANSTTSTVDMEQRGYGYSATSTWQLHIRTFVATTSTQNIRLLLRIQNGTGYFDDVSLIGPAAPPAPVPAPNPLPPAPTSTPQVVNLITDANMEANNLLSWGIYNTPSIWQKTASTSHSGIQSLRIVTRPNLIDGVYQRNVPVRAGRRYRLSLWYRVERGTFTPRLAIQTLTGDYQAGFVMPSFGTTNRQWVRYERIFTVPANFVSDFRLVFRLSNGESYVDDVLVEEIP